MGPYSRAQLRYAEALGYIKRPYSTTAQNCNLVMGGGVYLVVWFLKI